MAHIHLIEGPVGAGKSTFAAQLRDKHRSPPLVLDDWMVTLFQPDRPESDILPWYLERKERCIEQIWKVARGQMAVGIDPILELGLIQRASRLSFFDRMDRAGCSFTVYVLDAPKDVRRARVRKRNTEKGETFVVEVPDGFFELASDHWEPLDDAECTDRDVRFISTAA